MDIYEEVEMVDQSENELDIMSYAKSIIACQIEMKALQDDIKQIKTEAKENGVLVKEIDSAIRDIKRELKTDPSEKAIEEEIIEKLKSDEGIMDSIAMTI